MSGQRNLAGHFSFCAELRANGFASIASGYPDAKPGSPKPPYKVGRFRLDKVRRIEDVL